MVGGVVIGTFIVGTRKFGEDDIIKVYKKIGLNVLKVSFKNFEIKVYG
jgi:hypothetical protein